MLSGKLYLDGIYFDVHKQSHSFVEWFPQRQLMLRMLFRAVSDLTVCAALRFSS
jgi:hypothetical protein